MNVDKKRQELALYRLQQAEESFDEARYLLEGNKSPRSIINRIYYAMFYAILALLIFEPFSISKHTGQKIWAELLTRHLISGKEEIIEKR